MELKFCPLFSGSSGNALYIGCGGLNLLVDAGLSGSRITQELAGLLRQYTQQGISIPAGTLTGSQILTGRGPRVPFVVEPVGDVVTQVYHSFDQAGINQTRYQVMLQVTVQVEAICPGCVVHTQVSSSICLGETVIVGRVPEAFTQVETKDTIPGLVAGYGA